MDDLSAARRMRELLADKIRRPRAVRFGSVREEAYTTPSRAFINKTNGPLGPFLRGQVSKALTTAGIVLGILVSDTQGNLRIIDPNNPEGEGR